jgi:hypothetical protein
MIPDTIKPRGFEPLATAIAVRSIPTCPMLAFQPLSRPAIGIALFSVVMEGDDYRFSGEAIALRNGALPDTLIDWLEKRLPLTGTVIAHQGDSVRATLKGSAEAERHPRVSAFVASPGDRLQIMPRWLMRGASRSTVSGMPCLCRDREVCEPQLPACFLPDPDEAEVSLIQEAAAIWERWARHHALGATGCDPVCVALAAFGRRLAGGSADLTRKAHS